MITLSQLEYIVSVDRLRHFSRAAAEHRVAQPSLSMQIRKAEDELGFAIFDRDKQPVRVTEKGARFVAQAKVLLQDYAKLMFVADSDAKTPSGEFRLGLIPTLAPYILPLFIESFSERYPKVKLSVDELKTQEIIDSLERDELDAAILATPLHTHGLVEVPLFYEAFSLYLSPDHPLRKKAKISEHDIEAGELWMLDDGHCFKNQVLNFCSPGRDVGVIKNVNFSGGNLETLRYLIRKGRGYTLLPELFVRNLPSAERLAAVRPFARPMPSREVSLVYRRSQWKSDIIEALKATVLGSVPADIHRAKNRELNVLDIRAKA